MSASSTALLAGFNSLLASNGEDLTWRGGTVTGIVNREPFPELNKRADFSARDVSRIETLVMATEPEPGEEFVDAFGYRHRVTSYRNVPPVSTICDCKVSKP
jgi:hypothetical protein